MLKKRVMQPRNRKKNDITEQEQVFAWQIGSMIHDKKVCDRWNGFTLTEGIS